MPRAFLDGTPHNFKPLKEYLPPESDEDPVLLSFVDTGYVLNFFLLCVDIVQLVRLAKTEVFL